MGQYSYTSERKDGDVRLKLKFDKDSENWIIIDGNSNVIWRSIGRDKDSLNEAKKKLDEFFLEYTGDHTRSMLPENNSTSLGLPEFVGGTNSNISSNRNRNINVDNTIANALEATKESADNKVGLVEGKVDEINKHRAFLEYIYAASIRENRSPKDVLDEWLEDPSRIPEELQELGLDDQTLIYLFSKVKSNTNTDQILDIIQDAQGERGEALGDIDRHELQKKYAQEDEKGRITDPNTGIPSISKLYDELDPSTQQSITPDDLRHHVIEQDADEYNKKMKETGDFLANAFPDSWKLNWNEAPTRENAVKLHEELIKPGYVYQSSRPFDQSEHQLAASGHGKGSSTLQDNAAMKSRYNTREDLENIGLIQNQLNTSFLSETEKINQISKIVQAMSDAFGIPLEAAQKRFNDHMEATGNQEFKNSVFNRETAALRANEATQSMNENIQGAQLSEELNRAQQQEMQAAADSVFQYQTLIQDLNAGKAVDQMKIAQAGEDAWAKRQTIIMALRQEGRAEEAQRLQQAQNNKDRFLNILGTIGKIGLAAGLAYTGNIPAAAAVFAPAVASLMGGSSQQGQSTP